MARRLSRRIVFGSILGVVVLLGGLAVPSIQRYRRLDSIREALQDRDLATAYALLSDHLRREPTDSEAELDAARTARRLDDFDAADRHLKRYESLGGSSEEVRLERRIRASQSGSLDGASGALKFCADHPDHPSASLMIEALSRGFLAAGQPVRVREAIELWLKRDPPVADRAYAMVLRGRSFEMQADVPAAIADYRAALAVDPRSDDARFALAEILSRESPAEARPLYEYLLNKDYRSFEVRLGFVRCLRQLGELDRAAAKVAELRRERGEFVPIRVEAARIALEQGRAADAEPDLVFALERAPRDRDAHVQMVRCLRDLGREADARKWIERLTALDAELFRKLPSTGTKP